MNVENRRVNDIASNPWVISLSAFASIGGFIWYAYDKINQNPSYISVFFFIGALCIFCVASFYSIRVRQENVALRGMAKRIHKINHDYRNVLKKTFSKDVTEIKKEDLVSIEEDTIKSVCQSIEKIYSRLIRRDCLVTVKLITKKSGLSYCTTYARSETNHERDSENPRNFEIGTGKNLAFDTALRYNLAGMSHFFSADLLKDFKEKKYTNERQHFDRFYKSAIVVPIRYLPTDQPHLSDDIGFLSVDTLSRNRLNNTFHVELLAAFADQMYNFFCLMRGSYKVDIKVG